MWLLNNSTKYAVERTWTRDKTGAHVWLVVVKATFDISDEGGVSLAAKQPPPLVAPEYVAEPGTSSLRYEADLVPPKPTTDILVNGVAYAPRGVPVRAVATSVKVGDIQKQVVVHGERMHVRMGNGLGLSQAQPFVELPLSYEWAYGGVDRSEPDPGRHSQEPRNPVGRGFAQRWETLLDTPAWRIEYVNQEPQVVGPAGFGPIASHWSPRVGLAGTYDDAWKQRKRPLLPDDYDDKFVLCAPGDQQSNGHLRGGEEVVLTSLTRRGVLRFNLPRVYPTFITKIRTRFINHRARLGTVLIEPELSRLQMVWQTSMVVGPRDVEYLDKTVIGEKTYL